MYFCNNSDILEYLQGLKKTQNDNLDWKGNLWGATIDNLRENIADTDMQDLIESMTEEELIFLKKLAKFFK